MANDIIMDGFKKILSDYQSGKLTKTNSVANQDPFKLLDQLNKKFTTGFNDYPKVK